MAVPPVTILATTNLGLYSALSIIKPTSLRGPVSMLWTNICATFFSTQDGFKISINKGALEDDMAPQCAVIQIRTQELDGTKSNISNSLLEKQIFIVKCEASKEDTPRGWETKSHYLDHYCQWNMDVSRVFVAIAIGTKVKFWMYRKPLLEQLHDGVFDLLEPSGRAHIEHYLLYIRTVGWEWTGSDEIDNS